MQVLPAGRYMDLPEGLDSLKYSAMKKAIIILFIAVNYFAEAQIPQPDPDTTARHFLIVSSIKNLQEISAGQIAVKKAQQPAVRDFAQMMVKDHGVAEQQLLALAKRKGIMLPAAATTGVQPDLNLKNAGVKFDQLYMHAMVAGHGNTVQMFENYAMTGKDPDVRAFAQQLLPALKTHLFKATSIEKQLK